MTVSHWRFPDVPDVHLLLQPGEDVGHREETRVIALAARELDRKVNWVAVQKMKRSEVEADLNFLGSWCCRTLSRPSQAR